MDAVGVLQLTRRAGAGPGAALGRLWQTHISAGPLAWPAPPPLPVGDIWHFFALSYPFYKVGSPECSLSTVPSLSLETPM